MPRNTGSFTGFYTPVLTFSRRALYIAPLSLSLLRASDSLRKGLCAQGCVLSAQSWPTSPLYWPRKGKILPAALPIRRHLSVIRVIRASQVNPYAVLTTADALRASHLHITFPVSVKMRQWRQIGAALCVKMRQELSPRRAKASSYVRKDRRNYPAASG